MRVQLPTFLTNTTLFNVCRAAKLGSPPSGAQWVPSFAEARAPCDTRNVPSFLANVRGKSSAPSAEGAFASFPNLPIPRIFFPPKTVSFFTLGDLRTLLGYHSLISGSYRGPFARFPKGHSTAKQTTTNEYFCINLISSRAFSGSKEGRIRSMGGSLLEQPFCIKTRSLGRRRKEGRTGGSEAEIPVGIAYE